MKKVEKKTLKTRIFKKKIEKMQKKTNSAQKLGKSAKNTNFY